MEPRQASYYIVWGHESRVPSSVGLIIISQYKKFRRELNKNNRITNNRMNLILPDTARKSSIVVISSTASVRSRTWFSQAARNASTFSCATFDEGRDARMRAAFTT